VRRTATALVAAALGSLAAGLPPASAQSPKRADQVVLVLDHGAVHRHADRADPALELPDVPASAGAGAGMGAGASAGAGAGGLARAGAGELARAAAARLTFATALDRLLATGGIDRPTRDRDRKSLLDARRSLERLRGTRRVELGAVLANLDQIAGGGRLTPSRLPGLVLTLERNRQWWTTGPLLSDGQRVGFPGSQLVWEYYGGQGIEIQWLGTFGKANGYFLGGRGHDAELTALLQEAIGLATDRAGGLAWEYDFHFDGGAPPWVSGLAQGTAVQVLGRAAVRFASAPFFAAARSGLGIFETPPPEGVRVATPAGAHYLLYSFAPRERVINGFIQALVGLRDYAALANNDTGRALFAAGEAEARLELPHYDTGAWSLYDQSTESDLGYHTLLRDFLGNLCERLRAPQARTPAPAPTSPGPSGGTPPTPPPYALPPAGAPGPSPDLYCTTAERFTAYMHQPPAITLAAAGPARAGGAARLRLALSKISRVTVIARHDGRTAYRMSQQLGYGTRVLVWHPRQAGSYRLSAAATDLAGNAAATAATVVVAPAPGHRRAAGGH
jgi:hypothetical protein